VFRWVNSKVATLLARGLTNLKDPMAGFFAFPRHILINGPPMSPVGYKIGLEILTKTRCQKVTEVPIAFMERTRGQSKLTLQQQVLYLRHLRRLYRFKYPQTAELLQFAGVGISGMVVDLVFFLGLTHSHVEHQLARAISFGIAASGNWFLNRWFTFVGGRHKKASKQWLQFLVSATCGFTVNWGTYKFLTDNVAYMANHHLQAFYVGIIMGAGFNYMMSRFFVFRPFEQAIPGKEHSPEHRLDAQ
jgi:dolichol-phosphate mannosyltransferase